MKLPTHVLHVEMCQERAEAAVLGTDLHSTATSDCSFWFSFFPMTRINFIMRNVFSFDIASVAKVVTNLSATEPTDTEPTAIEQNGEGCVIVDVA